MARQLFTGGGVALVTIFDHGGGGDAEAAAPLAQQVVDAGRRAVPSPAVSPPGLGVDVLPELPVVGVKDSSGDAGRLLHELADYDGTVYVGSSALLTMAGATGAAGAILAVANAQPELCVAAFA